MADNTKGEEVLVSHNDVKIFGISRRKIYIFLVLIIFSSIIIGGIFLYKKNIVENCYTDENLMNQAAIAIKNNDNNKLSNLVKLIYQKNNYNKDVNCNFIIMTYYLNISDGYNAQKNFDQYLKTYNSKIVLNNKLSPYSLSINDYKDLIKYLIEISNQKIIRPLNTTGISK